MAHHKSALKRIRTSQKNREYNRYYRSRMRTAIRRVREATEADDRKKHLQSACAILDRLVSKGIVHKNTAARRKSKLHKYIQRQTAQ